MDATADKNAVTPNTMKNLMKEKTPMAEDIIG
jgi:hypothetical protein